MQTTIKRFTKYWNKSKDPGDQRIFSENRFIMIIILFWPGYPASPVENLKAFICVISPYLVCAPNIGYLFYRTTSRAEALDIACPIMSFFVVSMKQLVCIYYRERLRKLINQLQTEWYQNNKLMDNESIAAVAELRIFCRKACIYLTLWSGNITLSYAFLPLYRYGFYSATNSFPSNYTMELPYKVVLPYDVNAGYNFVLTYAVFIYAVYIVGFSLSALECFYFSLTSHITSQFKLLSIQFGHLKKKIFEFNQQNVQFNCKLKSELIQHVRRHNHCLTLVDELETIFSPYMFVTFMSSSLVLCLVAFQFLSSFKMDPYTLRLFGYLSGSMLQLFISCWISDIFKNEMAEIANSIYDVPWYLCSPSNQKTIQMIIMRGAKPNGITMAKFYFISLSSFQVILSTAASYYALLRTIF